MSHTISLWSRPTDCSERVNFGIFSVPLPLEPTAVFHLSSVSSSLHSSLPIRNYPVWHGLKDKKILAAANNLKVVEVLRGSISPVSSATVDISEPRYKPRAIFQGAFWASRIWEKLGVIAEPVSPGEIITTE